MVIVMPMAHADELEKRCFTRIHMSFVLLKEIETFHCDLTQCKLPFTVCCRLVSVITQTLSLDVLFKDRKVNWNRQSPLNGQISENTSSTHIEFNETFGYTTTRPNSLMSYLLKGIKREVSDSFSFSSMTLAWNFFWVHLTSPPLNAHRFKKLNKERFI